MEMQRERRNRTPHYIFAYEQNTGWKPEAYVVGSVGAPPVDHPQSSPLLYESKYYAAKAQALSAREIVNPCAYRLLLRKDRINQQRLLASSRTRCGFSRSVTTDCLSRPAAGSCSNRGSNCCFWGIWPFFAS